MSKKQWLIIIGVVIMVLPFLGFPTNWDSIISVILGFVIILISYSNNINRARKKSRTPIAPYVDSHSGSTEDSMQDSRNEANVNTTPDITRDSNSKI